MFTLIEVDWSKKAQDASGHFEEVLGQMSAKGGLDYLPRERTRQGRVFEHACDCRVLVKIIASEGKEETKKKNELVHEALFYV